MYDDVSWPGSHTSGPGLGWPADGQLQNNRYNHKSNKGKCKPQFISAQQKSDNCGIQICLAFSFLVLMILILEPLWNFSIFWTFVLCGTFVLSISLPTH